MGDGLPLDDIEDFTQAAKRWLGDKSELASKTLEEADWSEVYAYFKARNN
ncbi:hypothetical protein [Streptomyces prunicolor]|nr:hypothetical protein [Streptomyces prunicolor]